jgi:type IV conjugative transfer system protein TraL
LHEIEIPQTLDAPPLVMIFDGTQFIVTMAGLFLGLITGWMFVGLAAGYLLGGFMTRFSQTKPNGFIRHRLYFMGVPIISPKYPHGLDREYRP